MEITREEILEYALAGFELRRQGILAQIQIVEERLGRGLPDPDGHGNGPEARQPHKRSAAARRRMSIAQRRRWAKVRGRRGRRTYAHQ
jgi:hypothetical protein